MAKHVLILSFTPVTDEPRVLRQTRSFEENGWHINVCGMDGRAKKPTSWTLWTFKVSKNRITFKRKYDETDSTRKATNIFETPKEKQNIANLIYSKLPQRVRRILYNIIFNIPSAITLIRSRYSDKVAIEYYWKHFYYKQLYENLRNALHEEFSKPNLIVAHDYFTAPIAEKLAVEFSCPYTVDVHEYANGQYMHSLLWRIFYRPWVKRMQGMYLAKSAFNTTVCDGIANLLTEDYQSLPRPTVIRSTPFYVSMPYNPAEYPIKVLYHGIIYHTRGLDMAIESLPKWRPEYTLTFRGPGSSDYIQHLKEKAKTLGVLDRLEIEPPALFHQIVPEANRADIGYFIHEDVSPQKRFTLPNKFFEYIMAGLALCVSDLPEMRKIVEQYNLGELVDGYDPDKIAIAINNMDREKINIAKSNALNAAKDLCWENESSHMINSYEKLIAR